MKVTKSKYLLRQEIIAPFEGLSPAEDNAFKDGIKDIFYKMAETFTNQIGILCYYLRNEKIYVSYERIGKVFGKSRFVIRRHHLNFLRGERSDGRPLSLTKEELNAVKDEIIRLHSQKPPIYPAYEDILSFIYQNFGKMLLMDTLRKLILGKLGEIFRPCISKPLESSRMEVPIENIETNLMEMRRAIEGVPMNFCINIYEMGQTDYADSYDKTVIVPYNFNAIYAHYPVDRSVKRASVIACISPAGLFCPPQFAIEQRCTIDCLLYNYLPKDSLQIVGTDSGFVNTATFLLWLNEVFLSELHRQRVKYNYNGKTVIITDGLPAHKMAFNQINLQQENIVVHYLEAHASDQLQPLDLVIFGGTKRFLSNFKNIFGLSSAANQIIKIYQALFQICTPMNCRAAFRAAGIIVKIESINGQFTEKMSFNVLECCKVREYDLSHIQKLVQKKNPVDT